MALSKPAAFLPPISAGYDPTILPSLGAGANQPLGGLTSADQLKQQIEALRSQDPTAPQPMTHWAQALAQALRGAYQGYELNQVAKQKAANSAIFAKAFDDAGKSLSAAPSLPGGASLDTSDKSDASDTSDASAPAKADTSDASDGEDTAPVGGDKQAFIDSIMPKALEASKQTGLDPRLIVAQAAHESGWGQHAPGNNLFGIKSHGEPGGNTLATTEVVDGQPVRTSDSFRSYADPASSVQGYVDFVTSNPRYQPMLNAQGLEAQVAALGKSGYATDPKYGSKILQIAKSIPLGGAQTADAGQGDDEDTADATDTPPAAAANQVADASGTIVPQQAQGGDPNAGAPLPPPRPDLPPAALAGALKASSGDPGAPGAPDPKALAAALAGQQDDTGGTYANLPGNQPVPAGQPGMPTLSAPPPGFSPAPVQEAANRRSLGGPQTLNDGSPVPPQGQVPGSAAQPAPAAPQAQPAQPHPDSPEAKIAAANQVARQAQSPDLLRKAQILAQSDNPAHKAMAEQLIKAATSQVSEPFAYQGGIAQMGNDRKIEWVIKPSEMKGTWEHYTGKDGQEYMYQKDAANPVSTVVKMPGGQAPAKPMNQEMLPGGIPNPNAAYMKPDGVPVMPFRDTSTKINNNIGGENKGLSKAAELDAETVRKNMNEKAPALEEADHNFAMMQDAINRNGGKLPTGGDLAKLGLDINRTRQYLKDTWGLDTGTDPNQLANLETFNKGGIRASGELARAIGGNRVLKVEMDLAQRAQPGLETSDFGNKFLIDANRQSIKAQQDYYQAQEDYWRQHNHSLDGFQRSWNQEIKDNPRFLSSFSVVPPLKQPDGSELVKLPSTGAGGYTWAQRLPGASEPVVIADKDQAKALDAQYPIPSATSANTPAGGQLSPARVNSLKSKYGIQ